MNKLTLMMCGVALSLASCSTHKPVMTVFKDLEATGEGVIELPSSQIKIKPQDELLITVTSLVPSATAPYNLPLSNPATLDHMKMTSTPYQQTYIVNNAGDIEFPVIGKFHVGGLTTEQIAAALTQRIEVDVTDPQVYVQLVNFGVNVVGEVRNPMRVKVNSERFSLLDALASAGNMTEYGDRTNVMVIREENGVAKYHVIDLTKSDVVTSPYYYLQQNDVVMVQPTPTRESNARYDTNNAYKVQVVSTVVSAASVIASLVIALTVK